MRFPKLSELDRDQSAIYNGAPPEGTVLIMGPPGTGKSVIAFHRAHLLSEIGRNPRVIMYNKVLAKYASSRGNVAQKVEVSTLHKWAYGWWRKIGGNSQPPTVDGDRFAHDWFAIQGAAEGMCRAERRISVVARTEHLVHAWVGGWTDRFKKTHTTVLGAFGRGSSAGEAPPPPPADPPGMSTPGLLTLAFVPPGAQERRRGKGLRAV